MSNSFKIPELLCPAGDIERLYAAVDYGADAVYLAGEEFGMRTAATNFGEEDLIKGIEYAHKNNVKVHVTCNTLPRNDEIDRIPQFLEFLNSLLIFYAKNAYTKANMIPTNPNIPKPKIDITYTNTNTNMNTPINLVFSFSIKLINVLENSDGIL